MPALLHRHPQDVATVSVSASPIAPHSSNSRHMPRSRPAACAAAWSLSSADPGASDVHCILPSPDAARLPHLQQLARGADRRLLIGSATLAVAGLAFALRGPQVVAATCMAAAVVPALWLAGPLAGRSIARNGLAVLVALQLALACAIVGLSPALPIAVLLGCSAIAIVGRCGWPAASARSRCWYRRRRVLHCGRRCCRPRCSRADPVPRPGRAAAAPADRSTGPWPASACRTRTRYRHGCRSWGTCRYRRLCTGFAGPRAGRHCAPRAGPAGTRSRVACRERADPPGTGCVAHGDDDCRQRACDPLREPLGGGTAAQPAGDVAPGLS